MNFYDPTSTLKLTISKRGHVPSFKNNKMLARGRLLTNPVNQQWMDQVIHDLESQLRSFIRTSAGATSTVPLAQSWIAWSSQFDDSVQWIPEIKITGHKVAKGEEGARIEIRIL